jgi:hypothetical protein
MGAGFPCLPARLQQPRQLCASHHALPTCQAQQGWPPALRPLVIPHQGHIPLFNQLCGSGGALQGGERC